MLNYLNSSYTLKVYTIYGSSHKFLEYNIINQANLLRAYTIVIQIQLIILQPINFVVLFFFFLCVFALYARYHFKQ